jgi:hypothetical protein
MKSIRDLLSRDLDRQIEEVIKVDQRDEQTVYDEIREYIFTDSIKKEYVKILDAIADGPSEPNEAVGVWISGFFGSGKSSFAKNLGYTLSNRSLLGTPAGQLFVEQLKDQDANGLQAKKIEELVGFINVRIPSHVIMFDVRVDQAVRRASESIAEILYSVLLRELDYAPDYDVANLEIELEAESKLEKLIGICAKLYRDQVPDRKISSEAVPVSLANVPPEDYAVWRIVRKGAQKIQRTSAAMNKLDPATYSTPDSWAQSLKTQADITIRTLVDRTFMLAERRKPGQAIVFIVDELGAYVARSAEKIEHLRAVVEHFGQESKNRVLKGKAVAPVWVIVTSQEKLDEVVAAIDDKRVELARLQDRFHYHVNMAPADIRQVATRRVLSKTTEGDKHLRELYKKYSGQLKTHTQAEHSQVKFEVTEEDFVQFYPYLPYFVELSIDIVSGMRLQAGAPRHYGGSNRTIIKQAYEMLVSDRTNLADAPIGTLVTLDKIFDLMEGNLSSERQRDISDVKAMWSDDPWPLRVAKVIALLDNVKTLPRTGKNIAVLLYDALDATSPLPEVERAIGLLAEKQFIRQAEDGWKLLTDQEKSWTTERDSLNPTPKERRDIWGEILRSIFSDPGLSRYKLHRTFKLGVTWEGRVLAQGEIPVELRISDSLDLFDRDCEEIRKESREKNKQVYWALSANDELDNQVAELYRSKQMVGKYDNLRAQSKIKPDEATSLANEKQDASRREVTLKGLITQAIRKGTGFFEGVSKLGLELGKSAPESLRAMLNYSVPQLYPKIDLGTRPIKGTEAEEILKAANLNGLSKVFYKSNEGLDLVTMEGNKYVVNTQAVIAKELTAYMNQEHDYGNKVTGRMLEEHFGGLGYGWEREILWIVLASLLRAGVLEVTYQGRRFRNHLDAQVRAVFSGTNAFRSASFAPRKAPDLKTLVSSAKRYEDLTGDEVDVDETAIAQAFQRLAQTELDSLLSVEAISRANQVPVLDLLEEYRSTLLAITQGASDDVVNILEGEGESFRRLRDEVNQIKMATNEDGLKRLRRARIAVQQMWPLLASRGQDTGLNEITSQLEKLLDDGSYYRFAEKVDQMAADIEQAYEQQYKSDHKNREVIYQQAIDMFKGLPEWPNLDETFQENLLAPLKSRRCDELKFIAGQVVCGNCGASLPQIESDFVAVGGLRNQALRRIQEFLEPEEKLERVRVADITSHYQAISSAEEVDELIERLRNHLLKMIESGVKVILE